MEVMDDSRNNQHHTCVTVNQHLQDSGEKWYTKNMSMMHAAVVGEKARLGHLGHG